MSEHAKAVITAVGGALVGGAIGYLCFTERGRVLRRQIEPALDDIVGELEAFRHTIEKTARVANHGWTLLNEAVGEGWAVTDGPVRQSAPF